MWETRFVHLLFALASLSLLGVAPTLQGADSFGTFEDKRLGFTIEYPADWYVNTLGNSFEIDSYPLRKRVRGVGTPYGEAEVNLVSSEVFPYPDRPKTLDGWVESNTVRANVTGRREFELRGHNGKLSVIEVRSRFGATQPYEEGVWWYFQIRDRMFHASLGYWENDPKADKYLVILKRVVLSLKVTQSAAQVSEAMRSTATATKQMSPKVSQDLGGGLKRLEHKELGITVEYPVDWSLSPYAHNFHIEDTNSFAQPVRGPGTELGGAFLNIDSPETLPDSKNPQTLDDWAETDTLHREVAGKNIFELQGRSGKLSVIEVRSHFGVPTRNSEDVRWYFKVGQRKFRASLTYWLDDPKADKYLEILRQIVLSLKLNS